MMKKKQWKHMTMAVAAVAMISQCPVLSAKAAPLESGNWTLLPAASDEFDGTSLDEAKWKNGIWYDVTSDLAFHPDNVSVRDGNLVLTAKKETYNGKNYTAAAVESKFEVPGTATYVEVRAKALDKKANVLSAIWLQSSPLTWAMNPNPEIDIMETFDYSKMTSTLHTWRQSPNLHLKMGSNGWNTGLDAISADYHTYALERRDGTLRFYFDGNLTWERTSYEDSFVELSRHMVLSLEGHLGAPVEEYLPGEFLIDYVRTYYDSDFAGAPTDGLYQIVNKQSGKALSVPLENNSTQLVQKDPVIAGAWRVRKEQDDTWIMENASNGHYVDLAADGGVTSNGTPILHYESHGGINQKWYIVPTEGGAFKIISALSGKSLCVKDASMEENAPIIQWTYGNDNEDDNDEWMFVRIENDSWGSEW